MNRSQKGIVIHPVFKYFIIYSTSEIFTAQAKSQGRFFLIFSGMNILTPSSVFSHFRFPVEPSKVSFALLAAKIPLTVNDLGSFLVTASLVTTSLEVKLSLSALSMYLA